MNNKKLFNSKHQAKDGYLKKIFTLLAAFNIRGLKLGMHPKETVMKPMKTKKVKKIVSVVIMAIGLVVLLIGLYARSRVSEARQNVSKSSGLFPSNPVNKGINNALENKISAYDAPVMWTMISGVVILVIGVGSYFRCRR